MEIRQLIYFVETTQTLNFSEAAKKLCISQSTLSQQIKQLEVELEEELFFRTSHEVTLTEAGIELLPFARQIVSDINNCQQRFQDLKKIATGCLNIGVTYSFGQMLIETICNFTSIYPGIKLNIHYKTMAELTEMLLRRELDFFLAFRSAECDKGIEHQVLFNNNLSVIMRSGHPLAQKKTVTFSDIEPYNFVMPSKGLQARNTFYEIFKHEDRCLKVAIEINEVNMLLKLVESSNFLSILSESTIHNCTGLTSVHIDSPHNEMQGCVHYLKNDYHKHSAVEFIKMLRESKAVHKYLYMR
ncbi:MAG: LysR family transcriptional regulator [Bacteroidales bacterium]|nr:LysR family transcriptional regulator [Bacteroidales bacterium]